MAEDLFETVGATARARHLAPGLLHLTLAGRMDVEAFDFIHSTANPQLAAGGITMFFDTVAMTGFTNEFRLRMMAWQLETKGRQFQVVLLRHRLVALAIAVANKVVGGGVVVTADRDHFDRLLADAVRSRFPEVEGGGVKSHLPRL
ncbi:hypothetical protein [Brevundimonas sp.]|uniref:hypothetical protein n=1 Tax=Brevundimonas sp. TaxID=1871086 RepID=UPI00272F54C4|nr:hypothetical protein [Brevundimonas sp.]MDP1912042.1 hypothetical protein [Brevundimonas sp.]